MNTELNGLIFIKYLEFYIVGIITKITFLLRRKAKHASLKGNIMTYLNRTLDNPAPLPFAEVIPRTLCRGRDYWAIFAGTFEEQEKALARQAHYVDGVMLHRRRNWYIKNNRYFNRFEVDENLIKSGYAEHLETILEDEDMKDFFGANADDLLNKGDDHHIPNLAEAQARSSQPSSTIPFSKDWMPGTEEGLGACIYIYIYLFIYLYMYIYIYIYIYNI